MTAPRTPTEYMTDAANAIAALARISQNYGWAYYYALTAGQGDSQGSGQIAYTNPTGDVAEDPRRAAIREVLREINHHTAALQAARVALDRMMGREDERRPRGVFPRSVSHAELVESRKAQARRRIRWETYD